MKNIPWVSKSWYYKIQDKYIFGIAREAWKKEQPRFEQKTWYIIYTSNRLVDVPIEWKKQSL